MKNFVFALGIFLFCPSLTYATLTNGGFETGSLSPWVTIGDVVLVDSSFGIEPPQGHLQVLITNAPDGEGCLFCEHPQSYSGTDAVRRGFGPDLLGSFFGFTEASLPGLQSWNSLGVIQGSGIKQAFSTQTDILLSFTW